jgi:hypothetical protein
MLAGPVAQRLFGLEREHRDVGRAKLRAGHGGDPPRRGVLGVPAGGLGHHVDGMVERGQHGLMVLGRGEPSQRGG